MKGSKGIGRPHPKQTIVIVEGDPESRNLTATLEDKELDTIACESAEAALSTAGGAS
jgi:hypothetical protein